MPQAGAGTETVESRTIRDIRAIRDIHYPAPNALQIHRCRYSAVNPGVVLSGAYRHDSAASRPDRTDEAALIRN